MSPIYVEQGDEYVQMIEQPYEAELILRDLLSNNPGLLSGNASDESDQRWLLVRQEIGVPDEPGGPDRWSLDHLFLDQEGVPTLVEAKRSSDRRIRREVVGQMLDYVANAAEFWSVERIQTELESRYSEPDEFVRALEAHIGPETDPEDFWRRVDVNLTSGNLRLVFVADRIPRELRRIVEFLNGQMQHTDVLALEIHQYVEKGGTRKTLVPLIIGDTEASRQTKSPGQPRKPRLSEEELLQQIRSSDAFDQPVKERILKLYAFLLGEGGRVVPGSASINVWIGEDDNESKSNPVSISFSQPYGLTVNFKFMVGKRSDAEMERLADLLSVLPGAATEVNRVRSNGLNGYCSLAPSEVLSSDDALRQMEEVLVEAAAPAA